MCTGELGPALLSCWHFCPLLEVGVVSGSLRSLCLPPPLCPWMGEAGTSLLLFAEYGAGSWGSRDLCFWLGLEVAGGAPLCQSWCPSGVSGLQVMFSEEALPKGNGEYILGYYSNTSSSIAGVTEPFQVSTAKR